MAIIAGRDSAVTTYQASARRHLTSRKPGRASVASVTLLVSGAGVAVVVAGPVGVAVVLVLYIAGQATHLTVATRRRRAEHVTAGPTAHGEAA